MISAANALEIVEKRRITERITETQDSKSRKRTKWWKQQGKRHAVHWQIYPRMLIEINRRRPKRHRFPFAWI